MEYISSITIGIVGIILGLLFGWLLAKGKAKGYTKLLEEDLKENITEEEIMKQKKEDEEFWKMKGGITDDRKRKYRTTRTDGYCEIDSKPITGEPGEGGRAESVEADTSSSERKPIQDTPIEQPKPDSKTVELHIPDNL